MTPGRDGRPDAGCISSMSGVRPQLGAPSSVWPRCEALQPFHRAGLLHGAPTECPVPMEEQVDRAGSSPGSEDPSHILACMGWTRTSFCELQRVIMPTCSVCPRASPGRRGASCVSLSGAVCAHRSWFRMRTLLPWGRPYGARLCLHGGQLTFPSCWSWPHFSGFVFVPRPILGKHVFHVFSYLDKKVLLI